MASTAPSALNAGYFVYKAFQAFRLCVGDVTVTVELVAELLMQEFCEAALLATFELSAELIVELCDTAEDLEENTRDFLSFCGKLKKELCKDNPAAAENTPDFLSFCDNLKKELCKDNPAAADLIQGEQELFKKFTAIDTDGSGTISKQELRRYFAECNLNWQASDKMFQELDADNDGEITFEEFSKMLGPRNGRREEEDVFDCFQRHGLKPRTIRRPASCFRCREMIPPRSRVLKCIPCTLTACHDCTAKHLPHIASRITCKPRHGLAKKRLTYVGVCAACKGRIPTGATLYSCIGSCPVRVCVACVMSVPKGLYATGLRHIY